MNELTLGQVARICGVAPLLARRWFDCDALKGRRVAGSGDVRIDAEDLRRFMRERGMPDGFGPHRTTGGGAK